MANKENTHKFWENLEDYNKQILSIFIEENSLTKELDKIKNKKNKIISDFGCGSGNSFKYLKDFKKVYAIDYSQNMLNFASKQLTGNEKLILGDIKTTKLKQKSDISLAISSVVPLEISEFYEIMDNLISNTKKNGIIYLTLSSFESRIFAFQIAADNLYKQGKNHFEVFKQIKIWENNANFNTLGYLYSDTKLIQKQWLKEEIEFRLSKYNFKKIEIKKLHLNWETQIKQKEYLNYPCLWMWLIKIKN